MLAQMAKIHLDVALVNNTAFPRREISAFHLWQTFVGDDTGAPPESVSLNIYTDDGHRVHISVPADGKGPLVATLQDWPEAAPDAEPPGRVMTRIKMPALLALLGQPSKIGSNDEVFDQDLWECGCYASLSVFASRDDDRANSELDWVHCETHITLGGGPYSDAPVRFGIGSEES